MKSQKIPAEQSKAWLQNPYIEDDNETRALYGKPLVVEIREQRHTQTPDQRGKYWATLHEWGKELGYTVKETEAILHNMVLCEAYGIEGYAEFRGARWPIPKKRSSGRNIEEYSILIETLERLVA